MPKVKVYNLKPTERMPNSPFALLHYPSFFKPASINAGDIYDCFDRNGWTVQWIYRYGATQSSHYHSTSHECMAVLSGQATIRFGVADISPDLEENTHGSSYEDGGVEVHVTSGDVFVIPAGVAHKTYNTTPKAEFSLLTPGQGFGVESDDRRQAVASTQLTGFTMLGAYPAGCVWDFQTGSAQEEERATWSRIWGICQPDNDPVLGKSSEGLCSLWQSSS